MIVVTPDYRRAFRKNLCLAVHVKAKSRKWVACRAGIGSANLSDLMLGRSFPSAITFYLLAKALDTTCEALMRTND